MDVAIEAGGINMPGTLPCIPNAAEVAAAAEAFLYVPGRPLRIPMPAAVGACVADAGHCEVGDAGCVSAVAACETDVSPVCCTVACGAVAAA